MDTACENIDVEFKIFRYEPDRGPLNRYDSFTLPCGPYDQLLDILLRIKEDLDPTLSFRKSCRHGICGSCAVRVNNKPLLACKTSIFHLTQEFGRTLTVTPLEESRVLKDLIVDRSDYWEKYESITPYAETIQSETGAEQLPARILPRLADADYCIQCSACYYACPVVKVSPEFLGPAAFTKAYRFAVDPRDYLPERLELVNQSFSGVWDCAKCLQCTEACPKGIAPFTKITALHRLAISEATKVEGQRVRHTEGFHHAVTRVGIINELVLAFHTMRFRMVRMVPRGALMVLRRKLHLNPLLPRSRRVGEVKTLFRRRRP